MDWLEDAQEWINSDRLVAIGVTAQTVLIAMGLIYAIRQLREARRLRLEQFRPHVVVDVSTREGTGNLLYISMENIGVTVARGVSVTFEPPLVSTLDEGQVRARLPRLNDLQMWRDTPTLPPGRKLECLFEQGHNRFARRDEMPERTTATVRYRWHGSLKEEFEEMFVIDLSILWGLTRTGEFYMTDLVNSVRKIEGHLDRAERSLSLGNVRVVLETDRKRDARPRRSFFEPGPPKGPRERIATLAISARSRLHDLVNRIGTKESE